MILRLIGIHIYVAVCSPVAGYLVEPALGEAFQGPDSGQYDDGQEPKKIMRREWGERRQKIPGIWISVNPDSR
jgi:hypothetical protein